MINKREKLQYAYVFALDLVTLFLSVLLAWLITDGLLGRIVPYSISDWVRIAKHRKYQPATPHYQDKFLPMPERRSIHQENFRSRREPLSRLLAH